MEILVVDLAITVFWKRTKYCCFPFGLEAYSKCRKIKNCNHLCEAVKRWML